MGCVSYTAFSSTLWNTPFLFDIFIWMKHLYTLIALCLSVHLVAQPYLDATSQWKQYYRYSVFPPGIAFVEDMVIQFDGDTTVGTKIYHRVLKTGLATTYMVQSGDTTYQGPIHTYMDPIREEGPYFYAYDRQAGQEYLLYDFSAQVGDTLQSGQCNMDMVVSIDTVYLGDRPRKRFHLMPGPHGEITTLIEGVGPTFGLYWQPCNEVPDPQIYLQCFSQDGDYMSFDSAYDCSQLVLAEEVITHEDWSVRPNPFSDEIEVYIPEGLRYPLKFTVMDLMGIVVYESLLMEGDHVVQVGLKELAAEMYVVSLRNREGVFSKMVMKI